MCGIAGIVDWNRPEEWLRSAVSRMSAALTHRGPDANGFWQEPGVALAHRRLALIDLAGGHQPMSDPSGRYQLTYNGEIYNYGELRRELAATYPFQTESDTEVLLAAWIHWGKKCLSRLNGMFAFFIWDRQTQSGFAARDALGVKPFAYHFQNNSFAFASEAKALVKIFEESPKADLEAILETLVAPCFSGVSTSPFESVEYLQPGQFLEISRSGLHLEYWTDLFDNPGRWLNESESLERELGLLLPGAVSRSLTADVPVGTYLSGGFDSTLITALSKQQRDADFCSYTVAFEGQEMFDRGHSGIVLSDDRPFATKAAEEMDVDLRCVPVENRSLNAILKKVVATNDALPAWEQEVAQYCLAEEASKQYKAVLVGDAADETHYGYQFLLDDDTCRSPSKVFGDRFATPIRSAVMTDPISHFDEKYRQLIARSGHHWKTPQNRRGAMTYLIVKRWLPRLLHNGDIHAMAHGLEARVPFTDTQLLSLAQSVPPHLGFRDAVEKSLLRAACKGLLPESVRTRTKSALPKAPQGWRVFRKELQSDFDFTLDVLGGLLDTDVIRPLINQESVPTEPEQSLLFRMAALKHWILHFNVRWT